MRKELDRDELERLIIELLKTQPTCVIATCSDNIPRASPVEFFPIGVTLYIFTERGKKLENIRKNPRVSVAVHAPFTGWETLKGVQITGIAEIARRGSTIYEKGIEAYMARRGIESVEMPESMNILKISPFKFEYLDTALEGRGFHMKQTLFLE